MTCINTGISTLGPNLTDKRERASNCRNNTRLSVPFRPRLDTTSKVFLLIKLGVKLSSGKKVLVEVTEAASAIALALAASSLARLRSSPRFSLSFSTFSFTTVVFLSQKARPLGWVCPAPPAAELSEEEEDEEEEEPHSEESSESDPDLSDSLSESESLSSLSESAFFFFFFFPLELPLELELLLLELELLLASSFSSSLSLLLSLSSLSSLSLTVGFFRYSSMMTL
mmetsp:Transcript_28107/g.58558  ORF Transcript_28107/g.58558 Transcript_28107/m.58558 type:complete len:227 (-) Transcript_28107:646-1326(-)